VNNLKISIAGILVCALWVFDSGIGQVKAMGSGSKAPHVVKQESACQKSRKQGSDGEQVAGEPHRDTKKNCTSDKECGEGYSCWYAIPRGPSRGIPGSKENPGSCWHNEIILRTF
jgi:hypothetical protein